MSELPQIIELGAEEEAKRLWQGARAAQEEAAGSLVAMCEALDLSLRAVEILVVHQLQAVKEHFPATIGLQLETPAPEVEAYRDAVNIPNSLTFTAVLDLLSAEDLECVSPGLHRGWEDRRFSCKRSRVTAQKALGVALGPEDRDQLLILSAYRNRIFRCPPPVRVRRDEILGAFPVLNRLMDGLS
jgi:hypothetical protein